MRSTPLFLLVLTLAGPGHAATISANGTTCSLADAIVAANTNSPTNGCPAGDDVDDTVVLDADVVLTAVEPSSTTAGGGQSGLPDVSGDLTITAGLGSVVARDPGFTCDAATLDPTFRFLYLASGSLVLDGLSFEDGCFVSADATIEGGGVLSAIGTQLQLFDVWFRRHGTFATVGEIRGGVVVYGSGEPRVSGGGFEAVRGEAATRIRGGVLHHKDYVPLLVEQANFLDLTVMAGTEIQGGVIQTNRGLTATDSVFSGVELTAGDGVKGGVLDVGPEALTLERSTFEDVVVTAGETIEGGAVSVVGETTMRETTFDRLSIASLASSCRGGAFWGVDTVGTSALERVVLRRSSCRGSSARGGAMFLPSGTFTVRDALFRENRAEYLEQDSEGGGLYSSAPLVVERSAFVDNEVVPVGSPSADWARGGGLAVAGSGATLRNVTFSGNLVVGVDNSANGADGGDAWGGGVWGTSLSLSHVTLAGNAAVAGAGADGFEDGEARGGGLYTVEAVEIDNSILSGNAVVTADGTMSLEDCGSEGSFLSTGFNLALAPDASCGFSANDIVGVDPMLRPVTDNGCATPLPDGTCVPSVALDQRSSAVDTGSCADSGALVDARGFDRPFELPAVPNLVDGCDRGAFEARDTDGDGVTDEADPCPADPADACVLFRDGFESGDTSLWSSVP